MDTAWWRTSRAGVGGRISRNRRSWRESTPIPPCRRETPSGRRAVMVFWRTRWRHVARRGVRGRFIAANWCITGSRAPLSFVMAMRLCIILILASLVLMLVFVLLILLILLVLVLVLILILLLLVFLLLRGISAITQVQLLEQLVNFRRTFEPWNLEIEATGRGSSG